MGTLMPQGPNLHCDKAEQHAAHPRLGDDLPENAWCDGVPVLEAFVELTIRLPLAMMKFEGTRQAVIMKFLERVGLSVFVNYMDHPNTRMVMRARTQDGVDKVYPIVRASNGKGFKAVEDYDG